MWAALRWYFTTVVMMMGGKGCDGSAAERWRGKPTRNNR